MAAKAMLRHLAGGAWRALNLGGAAGSSSRASLRDATRRIANTPRRFVTPLLRNRVVVTAAESLDAAGAYSTTSAASGSGNAEYVAPRGDTLGE